MKNLLAKIRKSEKSVIEKWKKVHIESKRFCLYRNEEYIVPQRKGGGFRYIYIPLDATIEVLQAKAENIFFPEGTNSFVEKLSECNIRFASRNESLTPNIEPAGQSLIPGHGSQGLNEVVVSVDL